MFSKPTGLTTPITRESTILHPIPTVLKTLYAPPNTTVTSPSTATTLNSNRLLINRSDGAKEDEVTSSEEIRMENLTSIQLPHTITEQEAIFESAAKLLFLAVKWAKSIPSFNQIAVRDQNLLLEDCWAELFIIMSAQYGLPIGSEYKFFL